MINCGEIDKLFPTLISYPDTAIPAAAPDPDSPIKDELPILLANRDIPTF